MNDILFHCENVGSDYSETLIRCFTAKAFMNNRNLDEIVQRPDEEFSFRLESINSSFGISADTLRAIADSYDVPPERIVIRALTQWAIVEIPDLDLDEPLLSNAQLERLHQRRLRIDEEREQAATGPSLLNLFKNAINEQGNTDGHAGDLCGGYSGDA